MVVFRPVQAAEMTALWREKTDLWPKIPNFCTFFAATGG
jgi:hypothetical protein